MREVREQIDLDFNFAIVPPARTFADTMRLHHGWCRPSRETLESAPYIADIDGVDEHIEGMQMFAASVYEHFGGGEGKLQFAVDSDDVKSFVMKNSGKFMTHVYLDEVAALAIRYLQGEGDSYEGMSNIYTEPF